METCGEHGMKNIAYAAIRYNQECPACEQIEELNKEHDQIIGEKDAYIADLESKVEE